ncbi:probable F-box protein At2g36090 [Cajanus cajan]|uniref:F-box protein At2g27310 family n=1 Tax=Cajanus cajan TaxID=3821 RepID=A0A151S1D7_CAJCA|nr:probable F-box protein At2g36090 [Cajanus cajan]KYP48599.1 F-box protein At2g27310 family [Cajanus cajan]
MVCTTDEASCGASAISAVHPDVIQTHILTRLHGPALACVASTCSELNALSAHEPLWAEICRATWPSTSAPRVRHVISTFPRGSRSFVSDSLASFSARGWREASADRAPELISAVDVFFEGRAVLSRVVETETESGWFRCSPFRVDVLDPKEAAATAVEYPRSEEECAEIGEKLRLSWIVVDPEGRRAVEVSGGRAVSVERHWLSGEVRVRLATVVGGGERGSATEAALCSVTVTFGGEMQVREACLEMEDLDGMQLNGKESLGILQRALEGKRGKLLSEGHHGNDRFADFVYRKMERKERKVRDERRLDLLCLCLGFAILSFAALSTLFL